MAEVSKAADPVAEMRDEQLVNALIGYVSALGGKTSVSDKIDEVRAELLRRLGASAQQGPRCPKCQKGKVCFWTASYEVRCDSCYAFFEISQHIGGTVELSDFAQFFPAGASGVDELAEYVWDVRVGKIKLPAMKDGFIAEVKAYLEGK